MHEGAGIWFVAVALVAVFAGAVLVLVRLLRIQCPACLGPRLEVELRDRDGGNVPGMPRATKFRCQRCNSEFRHEDGGPMIPKSAWDAGTRQSIPRAKVHR